MSLLQQSAGLPRVLSITGSLVAGFRRDRRTDGTGAGPVYFMRTRCFNVGTKQTLPPLPGNQAGRYQGLAFSSLLTQPNVRFTLENSRWR